MLGTEFLEIRNFKKLGGAWLGDPTARPSRREVRIDVWKYLQTVVMGLYAICEQKLAHSDRVLSPDLCVALICVVAKQSTDGLFNRLSDVCYSILTLMTQYPLRPNRRGFQRPLVEEPGYNCSAHAWACDEGPSVRAVALLNGWAPYGRAAWCSVTQCFLKFPAH